MKRGFEPNIPDGLESLESVKRHFYDVTVATPDNAALPKLFFVDRESRRTATTDLSFFLKKDDARDYARSNGNLPMWSIDKFSGSGENAGAKYFCVGSYDVFWDQYEQCNRPKYGDPLFAPDSGWCEYDNLPSVPDFEKRRSELLKQNYKLLPFCYEVIMEGVPLHLYLDMEGCKVMNPNIDFDQLSAELISELRDYMCEICIAPRELLMQWELVVLDSSTAVKFSKHIIVKIPDCTFQNNYYCGALIRNFHMYLEHQYGETEDNKYYIHPFGDAKSKNKVCVLDLAVYTKFRDFRLIGSCKRKGCDNPKTLLRWLWLENKVGVMSREIFKDCLIQNTTGKERYSLCYILDTINNGIPCSSSLKTSVPLNAGSSRNMNLDGIEMKVKSDSDRKQIDLPNVRINLPPPIKVLLEKYGQVVGSWLSSTNQEPFKYYFQNGGKVKTVTLSCLRDGNYCWMINTIGCTHCEVKKQKFGADHKKGGRSATFLVWATGMSFSQSYDESKVGCIKQTCIANSCTGGLGSAGTVKTGYLGKGLPPEMRGKINDILRPFISTEVERLGLQMVGKQKSEDPVVTCDFIDD